jgi:hypothetical protein
MVEVAQVGQLVHHRVDQRRVPEGAPGAGVDQAHADTAVVEADAEAVMRVRAIRVELERGQPEVLGHPPRVAAEPLHELAVFLELQAAPPGSGTREGERELRVATPWHRTAQ